MRRAAIIVAAIAAAVVPVPREFIERVYTDRFYLALQPSVTAASNRVAVAWLDVFIVVAVVVAAGAIVRAIGRGRAAGWLRSIVGLIVTFAAAAAWLYIAFLVLWGWNYRRVPLSQRLDYAAGQVTEPAAVAAARDALLSLNRLYAPAHAAGFRSSSTIDPSLAGAFTSVQRALGATRVAVPGRPKSTMLDAYFRRTGVSGMTDPYFLETLVDDTLLPFERPFVVAHEWAHLAGYADEGEANFVGWLTCVGSDVSAQYSGWLFLYDELTRSVPARERPALRGLLDERVRADYAAIDARLQRNINPALALAGWRVYDQYLKANRVAEGTTSYDTVVRLVLGTKFANGWTPVLRTP